MKSKKPISKETLLEAAEVIDFERARATKAREEVDRGAQEIMSWFEKIEGYMRAVIAEAEGAIAKAQTHKDYEAYRMYYFSGEVPALQLVLKMMKEWVEDDYPAYESITEAREECLEGHKEEQRAMEDEWEGFED